MNYNNYVMQSMLTVMNGVNEAVNEVALEEEPADEPLDDVKRFEGKPKE